ncbi:MAG: GGDEF domain-containing protein [Thermodesulfobacteriota bacterium]
MTKFALTWRFASALMFVAFLAGGSYLVFDRIMAEEKQRARVIELSIRQRLLTQRVILLKFVVDRTSSGSDRERYLGEMQGAMTELTAVHARLTGLLTGPLLPPENEDWRVISDRVDAFMNTAWAIARQIQAGEAVSAELGERLKETVGMGLLSGMDSQIMWHQKQSEENLQLLDRLQLAILIGTLALLTFIGVALFRPLVNRIVTDRRELEAANEDLERLATADVLTGLFNRRKFDEVIVREMELSRRYDDPLSLLMFDIDHFKKINDSLGHAAGDRVLAEIASVTARHVRSVDYVFRWGGEEFLILTPRTGLSEARAVADKLRDMTERHPFPDGVRLTISLGVAEHAQGEALEDWLTRVDKAMYAAKRGGRNRVEAG